MDGRWTGGLMDGGPMDGNTYSLGKDKKTGLSYPSRITRRNG